VNAQIYASTYKDQPALTIESPRLIAQFLPHIGAKLCSLLYKPLALELLVQRPGVHYRVAPYDGDYVEQGECSGLDDMFPTIDRCYYERYPWQGTPIPDHGEVWSIPWSASVQEDQVHMTTYGVRFPYRLEKWISFSSATTLHIAYRLTNLSPYAFDFIWAAHPMFVLEESAVLRLPAGVDRIVTAFSASGRLGRYGDEHQWPLATLADGTQRDLRQIGPKSTQDAEKYYVKGKLPAGWCELTYPQSSLTLHLEFPVEQVPYLGVLPNEGGWQDLYNIFLEPASGPLDRLDVARLHGQHSTVEGGGIYEWHLAIGLSAS
jgi:galactose mutarotase-like enzyme